jgi:hypothetical protein
LRRHTEDPAFNAEEFEAEFQQSMGTHSLDEEGNLPSEVERCRSKGLEPRVESA